MSLATAQQHAVEALRQRIVAGALRPGARVNQEDVAAELGLSGSEGLGGYGQEFDADLAWLEKIGAGTTDPGFVEELADLEVPEDPSGD